MAPPPFSAALKFWAKLGFISFGGPAGQIALMHQEVVDRQKWISENQFLRALNFCMLLPGPEAQQLATYMGWRMHGTLGGIAAGTLFVIPSVFIMLVLSWLAVAQIHVPEVAAAFYGIQAVVTAVVVEAVIRIGKKALNHALLYAIAGAAFGAIFFLKIPFPYIVGGAALAGLGLARIFPQAFCKGEFDSQSKECVLPEENEEAPKRPGPGHIIKVFLVCLGLWLLVVGGIFLIFGAQDTLSRMALFFTKAAFVTFGGAYAVLSYITEVGISSGWISPGEMLTGLGLAESTPGPLIMVTQFVGFVGAWNLPGNLTPLTAAIIGALVTTYVTFLPCFFFIFSGAPYIEAMAGNQKLQAALTGVTASVVGVVLNLALWFGHRVILPPGEALDLFALGLAGISLVLLQKYHFPVHFMVPLGALAGIVWRFI